MGLGAWLADAFFAGCATGSVGGSSAAFSVGAASLAPAEAALCGSPGAAPELIDGEGKLDKRAMERYAPMLTDGLHSEQSSGCTGRRPGPSAVRVHFCLRVHDPWCVDSALEVDQTVTDSFGDRLDAVRDLKLLIDVL